MFYDIGVLDLLGGYMGEYLGVGAGWQDIVRVLLLRNLRELVFPDRFLGAGPAEELVEFPFFFFSCPIFHLVSLYHGLTVGWPRLGSTSISLFSVFFLS